MPSKCMCSGFRPTIQASPMFRILRCACWLQNFQCRATGLVRGKPRANSQGQRQHGPRSVPNRRSPYDGKSQRLQYPSSDVFHRFGPRWSFAIRKIAENYGGNAAEFSCLLKVHQGAVNLPWLHSPVFENQYCAVGVQFPCGAQRRFNQRHTATKKRAVPFSRNQPFSVVQPDSPAMPSLSDRVRKGLAVVTFGKSFTFIESGSDHGAIKRNPAEFLP